MTRSGRYVYRFSRQAVDGNDAMRAELGGKGAGLAEMALLSLPVPPGFTISTEACRFYLMNRKMPLGLEAELAAALKWLETVHGRNLDDGHNPLLVSVRSGAAVSMPGMMDTILNVGLTRRNLEDLARQNGSMRFALDSYRRLLQMFGSVVLKVPKKDLDMWVDSVREKEGVNSDSEISEAGLREHRRRASSCHFSFQRRAISRRSVYPAFQRNRSCISILEQRTGPVLSPPE